MEHARTWNDADMVMWLLAACGWSVAGLLFLVPACYTLVVHALAVVGFMALATGKSIQSARSAFWPPFDSAAQSIQRMIVRMTEVAAAAGGTPSSAPPAAQAGASAKSGT